MSQVTHQITIKWWHESKEIKEPTDSILREEAIESVFEMIQHGYLSGDLGTSHLVKGEEIHYRGSWELKKVE